MTDFAVQAKNIGKCYHIYNKPADRLRQAFWRGKRRFYKEFWAVREASFEIEKGETVGIIGSNGSGKSTLLQMICGILNPTVGELMTVSSQGTGRIAALLELGAGFNPEFTGQENVLMNAAIMGLTRTEIAERYDDIVAFADIGHFVDQPVKTYSSGMYVRLAFATAINVSPDILVVDEALAVGDIRFQQKCMGRIKQFCEKGSVIFVSHDMLSVKELCSRVIWVESGKIRMDGHPKLVVEKYIEYMCREDSGPEVAELPFSPENGVHDMGNYLPMGDQIRQFGNRKANITAARLTSGENHNGAAYSGQPCEISMVINACADISHPIAAYAVRDRFGREIFADRQPQQPLVTGKQYLITFRLDQWPNLAGGEYTLCLGLADGTMEDPLPCHFLYDLMVLTSIPEGPPPAGVFSLLNTDVTLSEMSN